MITRYKLTAKSSNRKIGAIPSVMTSSDSCSPSCPFLPANGGGCYAAGGPIKLWWTKLDRGEIGSDWLHFAFELSDAVKSGAIKSGSLLRHNTAGDLPHFDGRIQAYVVTQLASMYKEHGLRAFTYTHHKQDGFNLPVIRDLIKHYGFTVNLSCDSEAQASKRHLEGFPAVCVVPSDDSRKSWRDESGVRFQTCPAQLRDGVTCETCQLCSKSGSDRHCVVAFRSHGASKKRVDKRLAEVLPV